MELGRWHNLTYLPVTTVHTDETPLRIIQIVFIDLLRLQSTLQGLISKWNIKSIKSERRSLATMTLPKSVLVILSFQLRVRAVHRAIVFWVFWR
jgi:hypothetical protein